MDRSRKVLASVGVLVGAIAVGTVAAAAVDGDPGDPGDDTTTTTEETVVTSSTVDSTTPEESSTTTTTDTTAPEPELRSPSATPGSVPDEPGAGDSFVAGAHGLCTAFSGRPQPGNSQGWQRLQDAAGGDVEGYCAQVFAAKEAQRGSEPEVEEPGDGGPEVTTGAAPAPAPKPDKAPKANKSPGGGGDATASAGPSAAKGNGNGNGKGNGGKGR